MKSFNRKRKTLYEFLIGGITMTLKEFLSNKGYKTLKDIYFRYDESATEEDVEIIYGYKDINEIPLEELEKNISGLHFEDTEESMQYWYLEGMKIKDIIRVIEGVYNDWDSWEYLEDINKWAFLWNE